MKQNYLLSLISLFFIFYSCQTDNDFIENDEKEILNQTTFRTEGIEVLDKRLHFENASHFKEVLENYIIEKNDDIIENWNFIRNFYDDDFYSLRPPAIEDLNEWNYYIRQDIELNEYYCKLLT